MLKINKLKALVLAGCLTTVCAQADVGTGTIKVIAIGAMTFTEDTEVHFGEVPVDIGSNCVMDNAGAVTGDCTNVTGNQTSGQITVSGVLETSNVVITITGDSDGTGIDFAASADIEMDSASGGAEAALTNGTVSGALTVTSDDIVATVYGTLSVAETLTAGTEYSTNYTLDVTYN